MSFLESLAAAAAAASSLSLALKHLLFPEELEKMWGFHICFRGALNITKIEKPGSIPSKSIQFLGPTFLYHLKSIKLILFFID